MSNDERPDTDAIKHAVLDAMAPALDQLGVSREAFEAQLDAQSAESSDLGKSALQLSVVSSPAGKSTGPRLTSRSVAAALADLADAAPDEPVDFDEVRRRAQQKAAEQEAQREPPFDLGAVFGPLLAQAADPDTGEITVDEAFVREHGGELLGALAKSVFQQFVRPEAPATGDAEVDGGAPLGQADPTAESEDVGPAAEAATTEDADRSSRDVPSAEDTPLGNDSEEPSARGPFRVNVSMNLDLNRVFRNLFGTPAAESNDDEPTDG